MTMIMETWLPVPIRRFGESYEVSNEGRIRRSKQTKANNKVGKILTPDTAGKDAYPRVTLFWHGIRKRVSIHSLVAAVFIGPRPQGKGINHKNGVRCDNRPENLEYLTQWENVLHSINILGKQGKPHLGVRHHMAKLTDAKVRQVRCLRLRGWSQQRIADKFHVSQGTIRQVLTGKCWSHVT